ncbi:hypothetical protein BB561_004192 [Smittium simulii]|uniref:Alpha-1,3-glucosyltransferase n=1 Tax=Smittium simulii TaxID=133385 RepID=A0A2T9YHN8_9FUNG|nr:hypothetical protein BB561_004192 [Smittium simulii]
MPPKSSKKTNQSLQIKAKIQSKLLKNLENGEQDADTIYLNAQRLKKKKMSDVLPKNILFSFYDFLEQQHSKSTALHYALLFGFFIRYAVGMGSFSGQASPPMHGDYEAQRHWMEITLHLPFSRWYFYDLQYWGLDYPPLTAFHSYICGFVANLINPEWVALDKSRGFESYQSKLFMRATVIVFDFLIYIPGIILFMFSYMKSHDWKYKLGTTVAVVSAMMLSPWLSSLPQLNQIVFRVFPFARGLFEDKVANIWCSLSIFIKFKNILTIDQLAKLSAILTAIAFTPPNFLLMRFVVRSKIHEKTILLVALPILLLYTDEPFLASIFIQVATFSMYPLLQRDGLQLQYASTMLLWALFSSIFPFSLLTSQETYKKVISSLLGLVMISWHIVFSCFDPPARLPHLFIMINTIFSCFVFCTTYIYLLYRMFSIFSGINVASNKIKAQ